MHKAITSLICLLRKPSLKSLKIVQKDNQQHRNNNIFKNCDVAIEVIEKTSPYNNRYQGSAKDRSEVTFNTEFQQVRDY